LQKSLHTKEWVSFVAGCSVDVGRHVRTPETTGEYPEDFVNRSHPGSGMLALQHCQLLPESEIFQEQASLRSKAAGEQAQP
jgi:hypothetical protein